MTPRLHQYLRIIWDFWIERGRGITYRQLAAYAGVKATSTSFAAVERLRDLDFVQDQEGWGDSVGVLPRCDLVWRNGRLLGRADTTYGQNGSRR